MTTAIRPNGCAEIELLPSDATIVSVESTRSMPLPAPFHNTISKPQLITQGAEALLYRTHFLDPDTPAALKVRPSKPYRHPTLDARLTKQRVLAEARVLVKLSGLRADGVHVPGVLGLDWDLSRRIKALKHEQYALVGERSEGPGGAWLMMEWINGKSVKDLLRESDARQKIRGGSISEPELRTEEQDVKRLLRRIGKAVAAMHSKGGVVHGDLTTSNIMVRLGAEHQTHLENGSSARNEAYPLAFDGEIVLIDFGLAIQSIQDEDRAVDLYVLERAFGSTHPRQEGWFDQEVLQSQEGYRGSYKGSNVVLKRLEDVRLRGRKRSMVG